MATVVILTTLVGITGSVLLRYALSEFRLNQRNNLRFEAKNAAEAEMEYGAAELMSRLQRKVNFSTGELTSSPLTTQNNRKTVLFAQGAGTFNSVAPSGMKFWASQYGEAGRKYIDPGDPGNDFDPLRGQNVRTQTLRLLAQATATTGGGVTTTSYAAETIEIRDVFLFNYAIFYNIPMEFHPSPNMTVSGPVHSNVDANVTAGNTLTFLSSFTTAGKFSAAPLAPGTGRPEGTNIRFTTGLDQNTDGVPDTIAVNSGLVKDSGGNTVIVDSNVGTHSGVNTTFDKIASQTWRGNLQDSSMGVIQQNIPAVSSGTPSQAHDLIEPPDPTVDSASPDDVQSREEQKFAKKAGLYIVQGAPGTDGAASGTAPAPVGFYSADDATAYKASSNRAAWRSAHPDKVISLPTDMVLNKRRMYDYREQKWENMVDVDLGKMRTAVNPPSGTPSSAKFQVNGTDWNLDASTGGWNGQVYVEVENPSTGYTATSDVSGMGSGTGTRTSVRLVNGSQLPNRRDYNTSNATLPEGLTVATNAPVYICGNYNSPGVQSGDDSSNIGTPKTGEVPAAVIADAVNILSAAWWNSGKPVGDANSSAGKSSRGASNTEVCTAILTGNVGSVGSSYSGGVENFPRFHESWSGDRFRYRGSMVALFNSEVATGGWGSASYDPPTREWGFSKMFQDGRQPPGTPMIRAFRRLDYRDLSLTDFTALRTNTTYNFVSM